MNGFKRFWSRLTRRSAQLGREGEDSVVQQLGRVHFWGRGGKVLRNLYLPRGDGRTTEIDILYLTRKGLFVLESKNYSGVISGSPSQASWQSRLSAGRNWYGGTKQETYEFYNPIWQNETHLNALRTYLPWDLPLISVIVFSDHCQLGHTAFFSPDLIVCQQRRLPRSIRKAARRHRTVLSRREVEALFQQLQPLTHASRSVKRKHVRDLKRGPGRKAPRCPRCGGTLVLRMARTGQGAGQRFYGCSHYPDCRYTRPYDPETDDPEGIFPR